MTQTVCVHHFNRNNHNQGIMIQRKTNASLPTWKSTLHKSWWQTCLCKKTGDTVTCSNVNCRRMMFLGQWRSHDDWAFIWGNFSWSAVCFSLSLFCNLVLARRCFSRRSLDKIKKTNWDNRQVLLPLWSWSWPRTKMMQEVTWLSALLGGSHIVHL